MQALPPSLSTFIAILNVVAAVISAYLAYLAHKARKLGFPGMSYVCSSFFLLAISFLTSTLLVFQLSAPPHAPPRIWLPKIAQNKIFIVIQLLFTLSYLLFAVKVTSPTERVFSFSLLILPPAAVMLYVALMSMRSASRAAVYSYLGLAVSHILTFSAIVTARPWLLIMGEMLRPLSLLPLVTVLRVKEE